MHINFELEPAKKWYWQGLVLCFTGFALFAAALDWHWIGALLAAPSALLLVAAGGGMVVAPGDPRLSQNGALAAVLGILPLPFLALAGDGLQALGLLALLVLSYLAAGAVSLMAQRRYEGVPQIESTLKGAAHIGLDELLLGAFKLVAKPPVGDGLSRVIREVDDLEGWFQKEGIDASPELLHVPPPDLLQVHKRERRAAGHRFQQIYFDSGYLPPANMPGRERWIGYTDNQQVTARIFEHKGNLRPWLVAIHGYRMGFPLADLRAFEPRFFHRKLGLNIAQIILPLHGPRKIGRLSGDGFMEGEVLDLIHAEAQAQWDIRRLISWLRLVKHAPSIGVYGMSLGGYNTALVAGLNEGLATAVAGIPLVEIDEVLWRHMPPDNMLEYERLGLTQDRMKHVLKPVSPLSFKPKIATEALGIFGGNVDSLIWPDQPLKLQQHWNNCRLNWFDGSHLTFMGQRPVNELLTTTFKAGDLVDPELASL